jgi:hypothetical protein
MKKDDPDKYRLLVTAGPSYDVSTHKIVHVNTSEATYIENEFIRARVKVRIRGYKGLPSNSPSTSPYFSDPMHERDQYSIAFSFVPKQDLPSQDVVWGNDFDHPVRDRLPPGVNTAFKIVKEFVDPGLEMDAYADEPWLYGPALSCWFAFRIGDSVSGDEHSIPENIEEKDVLREGADGEGDEIRKRLQLPENNEKRRRHFLKRSNREAFTFEKGRLYGADFFNPYLDFGNFALKLPGFSIKVIKYIDEKSHTLRYVFKNRATGDVYMSVNLNLLWGEQLTKALKEDEDMLEDYAGASFDEEHAKGVESDENDHSPQEDVSQTLEQESTENAGLAVPDVSATNGTLEEPELPVGMIDKPDDVREQVQRLSITDLLQQTSNRDKRDQRGGFVADLD